MNKRNLSEFEMRNCDIVGWDLVTDWFGYSPNFHDAEVISISLNRLPVSATIQIYAWRTSSSEVDENGNYKTDRHATVILHLEGIRSLSLEDWNHQNVLNSISVHSQGDLNTLLIDGLFGLSGEIAAQNITASVQPGLGEQKRS
jgi:hypothetical protein